MPHFFHKRGFDQTGYIYKKLIKGGRRANAKRGTIEKIVSVVSITGVSFLGIAPR